LNKLAPPTLYRGDSDPLGWRKLKSTIGNQQFQTNLINGGQGRLIFETPLQQLINKHIALGWEKTHFLSFSEDNHTAFKYGSKNLELSSVDRDLQFTEYLNSDTNWDFAILEHNSKKVAWRIIQPGLYEGIYPPGLIMFSRLNIDYRILLFNVEQILSTESNSKYKQSIENARRNKEWLLLPAILTKFNFNQSEYSGILDGTCFEFRKFKNDA
jgi:hypothetical protein